jgi:hypothetical protein
MCSLHVPSSCHARRLTLATLGGNGVKILQRSDLVQDWPYRYYGNRFVRPLACDGDAHFVSEQGTQVSARRSGCRAARRGNDSDENSQPRWNNECADAKDYHIFKWKQGGDRDY